MKFSLPNRGRNDARSLTAKYFSLTQTLHDTKINMKTTNTLSGIPPQETQYALKNCKFNYIKTDVF